VAGTPSWLLLVWHVHTGKHCMLNGTVSKWSAGRALRLGLESRSLGALVTAGCVVACSGDGGDGGGGTGEPSGVAGVGGAISSGGTSGANGSNGGSGGNAGGGAGEGNVIGVPTTTPKGDPPPSLGDLAEEPAAVAPWTILVYGHADHNLSNSLLTDMGEMANAQMGDAVQLVVLADWDASQTVSGTDGFFADGLQLYRILGGTELPFELLAQGPEANLDDPVLLASIVRDVFTALPAERRGLILWDHGGSWQGGFGGDTQNGTAATTDTMSAPAVAEAVSQGLAAAAIEQSPPLDFFSFDTCLMAGAEVAYPFRDLAKVYIANAELDYGNGWDYAATLTYFAQNSLMPMTELAVAEVSQWEQHHSIDVNDQMLRSHAALDLSHLEALAAAASSLTSVVAESASFDRIDLGRDAFFAVAPYASTLDKGSSQPGLRDLGQVLTALSNTQSDPAVAAAAQAVQQALDNLVLASSQGSLRVDAQTGFHIEQTIGSNLTQDYLLEYQTSASDWVEASHWDELLVLGSSVADAEPPIFEHAVLNAEGATADAPPVLQFSSTDADAAKAAVYVAVVTPSNTLLALGLVGSGLIEPSTVYDFAWNGSVLGFADGQAGMVDIWLDVVPSQQPVLSIPGRLDVAGFEPTLAYLVFGGADAVAGSLVVVSGEVVSTLSTAEIASMFSGATFTPLYLEYSDAPQPAQVLGNPMPVPAEGFALFSVSQLAGNYVFSTQLTDIWGNTGTDFDDVILVESIAP
jgi:hypothetical protein